MLTSAQSERPGDPSPPLAHTGSPSAEDDLKELRLPSKQVDNRTSEQLRALLAALAPLPEIVDGLPNICGAEADVGALTSLRPPVYLGESKLSLAAIQSAFAVALHMHQPLVPAPGGDITKAALISNLQLMRDSGSSEARYNAEAFAECYARMGEIVPELVREGHSPRIMLDYSGELIYGLAQMGRQDLLERLRRIANDPEMRVHVEWLGTMWGHAVAPSTPPGDLRLQMRAWQHNFAATFGWEALSRVRGFSPPEMHLPNHPDVAYEYVKSLKECGYQWLLVQEHTVERLEGGALSEKHLPHRLAARNSSGEEASIIAIIKTQGSDTKLVAQMQPLSEARGLDRCEIRPGLEIPRLVTQISDGENGGVMMNEFPSGYRNGIRSLGSGKLAAINPTEYLELLADAGVTPEMLPACRPTHQGRLFSEIAAWKPGAADEAIAKLRAEDPGFAMEGGSWTNDISWVRGYENVLSPMAKLSAEFHQRMDGRPADTNDPAYRSALFHLLASQTSCFRYWGQGAWTDYGKEICRRGMEAVSAAKP